MTAAIIFLLLGVCTLQYTLESTQLCDPSCASCWNDPNEAFEKSEICYSCATGYIFSEKKCYKPNNRAIIGYGRECVVCGLHNYKTENFHCLPCDYQCNTCEGAANNCIDCRNGYLHSPKCDCLLGEEINEKCFCNIENYYITFDKTECLPCTEETRNETKCPNKCDKLHHYLPDEKTIKCPPCHYSCNECDGTSDVSCRPPDGDDNKWKCNNEDLFEEVEGQTKCYCVCHAIFDVDKCICEPNRIKGIDPNEPESHKYQCICPPPFHELDTLANGTVPCGLFDEQVDYSTVSGAALVQQQDELKAAGLIQ